MDLMMSCYKMEMRPPKEYKRKELMSFSAPVLVIASADDVFFPAHKVFPAAEHLFGRSVSMLTITGKHLPSQRTMLEVCDEIEVFEKEVRGAE